MIRPAIAFAACLLLLPAPRAAAETTQCTAINSLPAVIGSQGVFCLKKDLSTSMTSGAAITINANNVTLDCNDWKIGGLAAGSATLAAGVHALARNNVTIRNCAIRGFLYGVLLQQGSYHLVENNRIDLSTYHGIEIAYGDGSTVRGNRVFDTGVEIYGSATGINVLARGATVVDNTVSGVTAGETAVGILVNALTPGGAFAARNRIQGLDADTVFGLYVSGRTMTSDNMVVRGMPGTPATTMVGVYCWDFGIAKDNLVSGFTAPATPVHANCTASGNTSN